jgi:hypothetical protein
MIERVLPSVYGTGQTTLLVQEALQRANRVVLVSAKVLHKARCDALKRAGTAPDSYTIMSPQSFMKAPPDCDLIVVDELHVFKGKFVNYLRTTGTPVWRRSLYSDALDGATPEAIAGWQRDTRKVTARLNETEPQLQNIRPPKR